MLTDFHETCCLECSIFVQLSSKDKKVCNPFPLTLYSKITPFDAFEILCICKHYGKMEHLLFGSKFSIAILFSKVFKTLPKATA